LSWAKLLVLRTALLLQSLALKSGGQIFENPSIVTLRGCPSLPLLPASAAGTSTLSMCVSLRQPQRERCLPLCWWQQWEPGQAGRRGHWSCRSRGPAIAFHLPCRPRRQTFVWPLQQRREQHSTWCTVM